MPPLGNGDVDVLLNIRGRNQDALRAIAGVRGAMQTLRPVHRQHVIQTKEQAREYRNLNRELAIQRQHLRGLTLDYVAVRRTVLSTGIRGAVTGFNSLTAAVIATGDAFVGLAASAGEATPALAAFGAQGLGSVVQAAGVAKLALDGVGKALTTTGDAHANAMNKLTKPAQQFVEQAQEMKAAFAEIKLLAQAGMFPGINRGFKDATTQLTNVKQVVYDTATAWGYLAEHAGRSIKEHGDLYYKVASRNVETFRDMGDAGIAAFEGVAEVLDAAGESTDTLTDKLLGLTRRWRDDMRRMNAEGSLDAMFDRSLVKAEQWASISTNGIKSLIHYTRAGRPIIDEMTESIEKGAVQLERWTSSERGQQRMLRHWQTMKPVMDELARTTGATGAALVRMGEDGAPNAERMLRGFRTDLLPLIEKFSASLNKNILPSFIDLTREGVEFVNAIQPGLELAQEAIGEFVGTVAHGVGLFGDLIDRMPDGAQAIAGLAAGPLLIASWTRFKEMIELTLLRMRQLLGTATTFKTVGGGLAVGGGVGRGIPGRNTGSGGGNSSLPMVALGAGIGGGGMQFRDRPLTQRRRTLPSSQLNWSLGNMRDAAVGAGVRGPLTTPFRPAANPFFFSPRGHVIHDYGQQLGPTRRPFGAAADPRQWIGSQPIMGPMLGAQRVDRSDHNNAERRRQARRGFAYGWNRPVLGMGVVGRRRPPVAQSPSTVRTSSGSAGARAYREFLAQQGTHRQSGRGVRMMDNVTDLVRGQVGNGFASGVQKGAERIKNSGLLKGMMFTGALSGLIGAFSSSELNRTFEQRVTNFLSGATFGAVKSTDQKAEDLLGSASGVLKNASLGRSGSTLIAKAPDTRSFKQKFFDNYEPQFKKFDLSTMTGLRKFREDYLAGLLKGKQITRDQFDEMSEAAKQVAHQIQGSKIGGKSGLLSIDEKDVVGSLGLMKSAFRTLRSDASMSMEQINHSVRNSNKVIKANMVEGSESAKSATAQNYKLAAQAIKRSMKAGVISVEDGQKRINQLLVKRLQVFGLSLHQAKNYMHEGGKVSIYGGREEGTTGYSEITNRNGKARGGFATIGGSHQAAGGDHVPVNILAGRGEDVAVFNRHQREALDQRLADTGGLKGFFSRKWPKHSQYAGGGIVKLGRRLQKQGYHVSEHPAFGGVTPGAHAPTGWHPKGGAIDVNADHWKIGEPAALDRLAKQLKGWNVLWRTAGHHDHMHVDIGGGIGRMAKAMSAKIGRPRTRIPGLLGMGVQGALDLTHASAQALLAAAASGSGGVGETSGNGGARGLGKAALAGLWTRAGGNPSMAGLMARIGLAESSGDPKAHGIPTSGGRARGLWQIMWPLHSGRFPGMNPWNPLDNAKMAVEIFKAQGLSAWEAYTNGSYQNFDLGGLAYSSATKPPSKPTIGGGFPDVNSKDLQGKDYPTKKEKEAARKKKKTAKKQRKLDFTAPDLSHYKKVAAKKRKVKKPPKWIRKLTKMNTGIPASVLPNLDKMWETPLSQMFDNIATYTSVHNRLDSQEEAIVTGPNGEDVLNWMGMVNQDGKFVPGINQHVGELEALLTMHTGTPTGALGGKGLAGGTLGVMNAYAESISGKYLPGLGKLKLVAQAKMAELRKVWNTAHTQRAADKKVIDTLTKRPGTWQDRVATLEERIDIGQKALDDLPTTPLTTHGRNQRKKLGVQLRNYRSKVAELKRDKPAPDSLSKKEKAALRDARGDLRDENKLLDTIGGRSRWAPRSWGSDTAGGRLQSKIDTIGSKVTELTDRGYQLTRLDIPQERDVEIPDLISELNDWKNAKLPVRPNASDDGRKEMELEMLRDQLKASTLANAQFSTLRDFAQSVGMRFLGSFAHGSATVERTGLALVHRNETIGPDPDGPFRSGMTASRLGGGGHSQVEVIVKLDEGGLLRVVDQRVVKGAAQVTTRATGQRSRLIRAAG